MSGSGLFGLETYRTMIVIEAENGKYSIMIVLAPRPLGPTGQEIARVLGIAVSDLTR
jgi:hypothetical protein